MKQERPPQDGIEKWAEWLDSQPKNTRLTKEQMNMFMAMTMNEAKVETDSEARSLIEPKRQNFASMLYNRIENCHTYTISVAAAVFLSTLINKPGEAVIYTNYLQYKAFKMGKKRITMREVALIWPYGYFSEETLHQAWDRQKMAGCYASNMLDSYEAQKSIEIHRERTDVQETY